MSADAQRVPARGFSLLELSATLAMSAVVAGVAVGLFSTIVGSVAAWRARIGIERRATIVADWLQDELALAGGGPLPRRQAVALDDDGALHLLYVVPPAVEVRGVGEGPGCSNGLDPRDPGCTPPLSAVTSVVTFQPAQWPFPLRDVEDNELAIPASVALCPSVRRTPLLALVAGDDVAVVEVAGARYDNDDDRCEVSFRPTSFPGTAAPGGAFDGGAAIPVRWRTLATSLDTQALRSSWNGHPPERVSAAAVGPTPTPLPDVDVAVAARARVGVRSGADTDDDGFVDAWQAGATPVARRDAVEVGAVIAARRARAPAGSVTLPSGEAFVVPEGAVAALAVARVTLAGVTR
jgi:prepilin-type N-terminal cleavage/methylation domain-containing protein